jgi:hypothetical protein
VTPASSSRPDELATLGKPQNRGPFNGSRFCDPALPGG